MVGEKCGDGESFFRVEVGGFGVELVVDEV